MQVIKEKLEIDESLKKRIMNLLKFQNIKGTLVNGNIISIPKTNLAYIEPHKLVLENNNLNHYIRAILKAIKTFFRELLHILAVIKLKRQQQSKLKIIMIMTISSKMTFMILLMIPPKKMNCLIMQILINTTQKMI